MVRAIFLGPSVVPDGESGHACMLTPPPLDFLPFPGDPDQESAVKNMVAWDSFRGYYSLSQTLITMSVVMLKMVAGLEEKVDGTPWALWSTWRADKGSTQLHRTLVGNVCSKGMN